MIQQSFADLADLAAYLGVDESTLTDTDLRYLYRASEMINAVTNGAYSYDERLSADEPYPSIQRAVCAQVEYWRANGESIDTEPAVTGYSIGKYAVQYAAGGGGGAGNRQRLAPRALDALYAGGALYQGAGVR